MVLALGFLVAACDDSADDAHPVVEIKGGGFVFNYREAEAFYGLTIRPLQRLAPGTVIEVAFQDPAGGPEILVREEIRQPSLSYMFRTPGLTGVEAGVDYRASVTVRGPGDGAVLGRLEKTFRSSVDQSVLPAAPLTIGPGYMPNPALQDPTP